MLSHMASYLSVTARGWDWAWIDTDEGLASLPVTGRLGQEPTPAVLPAAPLRITSRRQHYVSSQQLIMTGWRSYKIRILFHN